MPGADTNKQLQGLSVGPNIDVASANVLYSLESADARRALGEVLDLAPDLIGLQEWYPSRFRLLRETGRLGLVPQIGGRSRRRTVRRTPEYLWNMPLVGGCTVGARADRFDLVRCRTRFLSGVGPGDQQTRRLTMEPARAATIAVYRDRHHDRTLCLVNYHLVSGVQVDGRYRTDRPVLVARHQHEARNLQRLVREQLDSGHIVYAPGDSNFDGFHLDGLTSAWDGREHEPGTLGPRRKVDDVHGPGPAQAITMVATASDHNAIVVRRRQDTVPASLT